MFCFHNVAIEMLCGWNAVVTRQELLWHLLSQLRDNNSIYMNIYSEMDLEHSLNLFVFDFSLHDLFYKQDKLQYNKFTCN